MKISDFKLAEYFLRRACRISNVAFVDLPLEFTDQPQSALSNGRLEIFNSDSLGKTILAIISTYLLHINRISGENVNIPAQKQTEFLTSALAVLRDMSYETGTYPVDHNVPVESALNHQPFVWLLMRDLICPVFERPLRNIKIRADKTPYVDGAKLITSTTVAHSNNVEFPFIFLNLSVENQSYRQAFLFLEALKAHGLEPLKTVHEILSKQEIREKFLGMVKIALIETHSINNFVTLIGVLNDYQTEDLLLTEKNASGKTKNGLWTQSQYTGGNAWWYIGLIEKLLEPSRGADWTAYEVLKPYTQELWEKIEREKKRRGLPELPMELLLRVQSEDFAHKPNLIIQGLLADNRVW